MKRKVFLTLSALFFSAVAAQATPFTINSILTGDPRIGNPDNLIVNVTITGNTTSNLTSWVFDINSPAHPDIKLDDFYFNLVVSASNVTFGNFSPLNWSVISPSGAANGSGNANFLFKVLDPPGNPKAADVTNAVDLTFDATLSSGTWATSMFTGALYSASSDSALGRFQLGAHLQSLEKGAGETDSGFARGNYVASPVPEPATMLLFGAGLVGLAGIARRKIQ